MWAEFRDRLGFPFFATAPTYLNTRTHESVLVMSKKIAWKPDCLTCTAWNWWEWFHFSLRLQWYRVEQVSKCDLRSVGIQRKWHFWISRNIICVDLLECCSNCSLKCWLMHATSQLRDGTFQIRFLYWVDCHILLDHRHGWVLFIET